MVIGSATILYNIDFVLTNLNLNSYFPVVVSADEMSVSANRIPVLQSAYNAGMAYFVLTTTHPIEDFAAYTNVIGYAKDYTFLEIVTDSYLNF